jgi:hypothetical protein
MAAMTKGMAAEAEDMVAAAEWSSDIARCDDSRRRGGPSVRARGVGGVRRAKVSVLRA